MSTPGVTSLKAARAPIQACTCGQRIIASLPLLWAKWVSLHDASGRLHWSNGEVPSPSEHEAVRVALESFVGGSAPTRVNHPLQRGRTAVLLRAADDTGFFLGFVMVVVEDRWLRAKGPAAPDLPAPVVRAVREWAVTLANPAYIAPSATSINRTLSATTASNLAAPQVVALLEPAPKADDVLTAEFRERLQNFAMELHAQHLTPIQAGARIRRYEVLMRALGTTQISAAPEALIACAVQRGLSAVLDRRVVAEVLTWLHRRSEIWSGEPTQFSVNLAGDSLRDPDFMQFLATSLQDSQLPRALLAFELEYEFCRSQPQFITELAAQLEQAGAGLVIDNFSLSDASPELLLLPGMRSVKLDPRMTSELTDNRASQARVAAIAQMARVAGVHVVAKRIEQAREQALLQALGVDFIQGYAGSAPAPLAGFDAEREQRLVVDPSIIDAESGALPGAEIHESPPVPLAATG
jgi:EAL domain-containing protein (putative c-di-GMP-specific phosphodiesterase class I)